MTNHIYVRTVKELDELFRLAHVYTHPQIVEGYRVVTNNLVPLLLQFHKQKIMWYT